MSHGLRVYGPDGVSLVLGEAMRYQRIMSQTYFNISAGNSVTYPCSDAYDKNLVRIVVSQYEVGFNSVQTSSIGAAFFNLELTIGVNEFTIANIDLNGRGYAIQGDVIAIRVG